MLLMTVLCNQHPRPTPIVRERNTQILYSPYFGSRNSSISSWILSGDGRTKHRHRKCRIFSRPELSRRLCGQTPRPPKLPIVQM